MLEQVRARQDRVTAVVERGVLHDDDDFAERDRFADPDRDRSIRFDRLTVHLRAVRAREIDDRKSAARADREPRVLARERHVVDDDGGVERTTDDHRSPQRERMRGVPGVRDAK